MKILGFVAPILNYGFLGLAFLFAWLSYLLLQPLFAPETDPTQGQLILGSGFLLFCLLTGVGAVSLEFVRLRSPANETPWGGMQGPLALSSFRDGGDSHRLNGVWEAKYYVIDEHGNKKKYEVTDPETERLIDYPPATVVVSTRGAAVSCATAFTSGEKIPYWFEGRISHNSDVTLVYWAPDLPDYPLARNTVGVAFLELKEDLTERKLVGMWLGRTRDGEITRGPTEWVKKSLAGS